MRRYGFDVCHLLECDVGGESSSSIAIGTASLDSFGSSRDGNDWQSSELLDFHSSSTPTDIVFTLLSRVERGESSGDLFRLSHSSPVEFRHSPSGRVFGAVLQGSHVRHVHRLGRFDVVSGRRLGRPFCLEFEFSARSFVQSSSGCSTNARLDLFVGRRGLFSNAFLFRRKSPSCKLLPVVSVLSNIQRFQSARHFQSSASDWNVDSRLVNHSSCPSDT